jgi:hypothetical protein
MRTSHEEGVHEYDELPLTSSYELFKNENRDDEFLISRILFLATYETNLDFDRLCNKYSLTENINAVCVRARFSGKGSIC